MCGACGTAVWLLRLSSALISELAACKTLESCANFSKEGLPRRDAGRRAANCIAARSRLHGRSDTCTKTGAALTPAAATPPLLRPAVAASAQAAMGALRRLLLLLQAAAALNVSVVPAYFRSPKERRSFRTYGKWQIDERRCDKFIRNRAYDKTCQQMDPKPYELLPLLVTGAPGSGTRAVFEHVFRVPPRAGEPSTAYELEFVTVEDRLTADALEVRLQKEAVALPRFAPGGPWQQATPTMRHMHDWLYQENTAYATKRLLEERKPIDPALLKSY